MFISSYVTFYSRFCDASLLIHSPVLISEYTFSFHSQGQPHLENHVSGKKIYTKSIVVTKNYSETWLPELKFCSKMVSRHKLSFQKWSQEKISGNIFWNSNSLPVTIFEDNFSSGNHFSKQYLVLVIDFHINFLFWKYDFQDFVK